MGKLIEELRKSIEREERGYMERLVCFIFGLSAFYVNWISEIKHLKNDFYFWVCCPALFIWTLTFLLWNVSHFAFDFNDHKIYCFRKVYSLFQEKKAKTKTFQFLILIS